MFSVNFKNYASRTQSVVWSKGFYDMMIPTFYVEELCGAWCKSSLFQRLTELTPSVCINWSGKEFKNGVVLPLPAWEEC